MGCRVSEWIKALSQLSPGMRAAYLDYPQHRDLPTLVCGDLAFAFARELPSLPAAMSAAVFAEIERLASLPEPIPSVVLTGFIEGLVHADRRDDFDFRPHAHLVGRICRDFIHGYDQFTGTTTRGFER